jgi:hypothetical protein
LSKCYLDFRNLDLIFIYIFFRFRPIIVKETIHNVLNDRLSGKVYDVDETTDLCKVISDEIKTKLKGTIRKQLKFIFCL